MIIMIDTSILHLKKLKINYPIIFFNLTQLLLQSSIMASFSTCEAEKTSGVKEGKLTSECKIVSDDHRRNAITVFESYVKIIEDSKIETDMYDSFFSGKKISKLIKMCRSALMKPIIKESSMLIIEYWLMLLRSQTGVLSEIMNLGEKMDKFKDEKDLSMKTKIKFGIKTLSSGVQYPMYVTIETECESDEDDGLEKKFTTTVSKDRLDFGEDVLTSCWHTSDDDAIACHKHFVGLLENGSTVDKIKWKTEGAPSSHSSSFGTAIGELTKVVT